MSRPVFNTLSPSQNAYNSATASFAASQYHSSSREKGSKSGPKSPAIVRKTKMDALETTIDESEAIEEIDFSHLCVMAERVSSSDSASTDKLRNIERRASSKSLSGSSTRESDSRDDILAEYLALFSMTSLSIERQKITKTKSRLTAYLPIYRNGKIDIQEFSMQVTKNSDQLPISKKLTGLATVSFLFRTKTV